MDSRGKYEAIGVMSGSSLDGVDVAWVAFTRKGNDWHFKLLAATTYPYPATWFDKLANPSTLTAEALAELHSSYGRFLGRLCKRFVKKHRIHHLDAIASHGHTLYHNPKKGFTFQLGDGAALAAEVNVPVVSNFRTLDIALGGEGAPLVPVGDAGLFGAYDVCLNIGGIANLSYATASGRRAGDICVANMALNHLARATGHPFDRGGAMAARGTMDIGLLRMLQSIRVRHTLGREVFEHSVQPLLDAATCDLEDRLRTATEYIAEQIATALPRTRRKLSVLCTGGGAFNTFLVSRIQERCGTRAQLVVPDRRIVKFKEAIVFAFLGIKRLRGEVNVWRSVTHARRDSSSGTIT